MAMMTTTMMLMMLMMMMMMMIVNVRMIVVCDFCRCDIFRVVRVHIREGLMGLHVSDDPRAPHTK